MIEFSHLYKTYNNQIQALKNISFTINTGEFVFLTGPSGAGKSTIFKMINGYELPTSGMVSVAKYDVSKLTEKEIPFFRRKLGIVFQDFKLLNDRSVYENIALPLKVQHFSDIYIKKRVYDVLDLVGLGHKKDQIPECLSGGEQQRTAIARAIIHQPEVLIADEPTGNLDPEMSEHIIDVFEKVCAQGTTVFIATHDHEMVKKRNKRVLAISNGSI